MLYLTTRSMNGAIQLKYPGSQWETLTNKLVKKLRLEEAATVTFYTGVMMTTAPHICTAIEQRARDCGGQFPLKSLTQKSMGMIEHKARDMLDRTGAELRGFNPTVMASEKEIAQAYAAFAYECNAQYEQIERLFMNYDNSVCGYLGLQEVDYG